VNLYGAPTGRRVETETAPLVAEGKVPWQRIDDDTLFKGEKVVEQYGTPPRSTSVRRRVYAPDGKLMYDSTWRSYYVGEPTIVRIGTKQRPKPAPKQKQKPAPADGAATTPDTGAAGGATTPPNPGSSGTATTSAAGPGA
jgi:hypothetical protein